MDENLIQEGIAREIVNKINTMRKELDFEVTDRIIVRVDTTKEVREAFEAHQGYISREVLAKEVHFEKCEGTKWDLNKQETIIQLEKL